MIVSERMLNFFHIDGAYCGKTEVVVNYIQMFMNADICFTKTKFWSWQFILYFIVSFLKYTYSQTIKQIRQ